MRIEQLYAIVEVGQSSSMSEAAQKLHTSSQNVSKTISQLEKELNIILFTRSSQGVFLTPEGKVIYDYACDIVKRIDMLKQYTNILPKQSTSVVGSLHITANISLSSLMVDLLEKMRFFYPNIRISLDSTAAMPTVENFASGKCQASFISLPEEGRDFLKVYQKEADIFFFEEENLKVFMNRNSPYINQNHFSLKTLSKLPFIDYLGEFSSSSFAQQVFARYGLAPNIIFSCNNSQLTLDYISKNDAYCFGTNDILKASSVVKQLPLVIKPLKERINIMRFLLVSKNRKKCGKEIEALVKVFSQHVAERYEKIIF